MLHRLVFVGLRVERARRIGRLGREAVAGFKGRTPDGGMRCIFIAYRNADSARVFKVLYSLSVSLRIITFSKV